MNDKRKEALDTFIGNLDRFDRYAAAGYAKELLDFRPAIEDAWTIREHLVHLMDAEIILHLRIKRAIAEPGIAVPDLAPFIRGEWVKPLRYFEQSVIDTVEAFKRIRTLTHSLLLSRAEEDWDGYYIERTNGEKPTIEDMLKLLIHHDGYHIDFIERNEDYWERR